MREDDFALADDDDYFKIFVQTIEALFDTDKISLSRSSQTQFFQALDEISKIEFDVPSVWWSIRAGALNRFERHEEALTYWNKAIEYDNLTSLSDDYFLIANKLETLYQLNCYEQAINLTEEFLDKFPYDLFALDFSVKLYYESGNYEKTIRKCEKLWEVAEKDLFENLNHSIRDIPVKTWNNYADCCFMEKKFDKAESILRDARKYYPTNDVILTSLSQVLFKKRKFEEAISYIEEAISIQTNNADGWLIKSEILLELENFEDSLDCLFVAVSLDPSLKDYVNEDGSHFQEKFADNERFKKIIS